MDENLHMNSLVRDRKLIAKRYVKFWFWLDLISIIPFDIILEQSGNLGDMAKFTKVGRLYKMIRMLRMVKMIRLFKDRKKIINNLDSILKVNAGYERIVFFLLGFILFNHTFACIWIMLAAFHEEHNWRTAFQNRFRDIEDYSFVDDYSDGDWYLVGWYFIATTVTTVGYGDINPVSNVERFFCNLLMFIGVISFSFATGALGQMIANSDNAQANLQDKLQLLRKIRQQYRLTDKLFNDL